LGLTAVPGDHLATVVTTLEMRTRLPLRPMPPSPLRLERWRTPDPDRYRALFRRVGEPWLWYSRLVMDDAALIAATHREITQVHAVVDARGVEVGLLELTHPEPDWCAIDYFALVPELVGQGLGRWLMAMALQFAWRPGVAWVRLNTCTLDHPRALGFYRLQGFTPVARALEIFPDPRLAEVLPRGAGPHVPLLGG
jgi:GNAT superfamily N-acetyltransferase